MAVLRSGDPESEEYTVPGRLLKGERGRGVGVSGALGRPSTILGELGP